MNIGNRLLTDLQNELGINQAQAAGIVGNLAHESAGFQTLQEINPLVPGSKGGYGYAQWTGPRRKAFEAWSQDQGLSPDSYEANKGFLVHELTNTPESRVMKPLTKAQTPEEAAQIFSDQFLRPGIPHNDKRIELAQKFSNDTLVGGQGADTFPDTGFTIEQQRAIAMANARRRLKAKQPQPQQEEKVGLGRTVFDQSLQGATFGFADEATDRLGAAIAATEQLKPKSPKMAILAAVGALGAGKGYEGLLKEARSSTKELQQKQFEQRPIESILANIGGGILTGGAGATTKTGQAIANSARNSKLGARVAKGIGLGAVSGGAYGAGTAQDGERIAGAGRGAVLGGVTGGALPAIGAAGTGVKNAVIPQIDDAIKPIAQRARDFGIPLRADQVAPTRARNTVQKISQVLPGSGSDAFERKQQEAFTKAVAKTIGEEAEDLGPETIQKFLKQTSKSYDEVLEDQVLDFTRLDKGIIDDIIIDAENTLDEGLAKVIRKNGESLLRDISVDGVKGEKVSSIRSQLIKRASRAQGGAKQYLNEFVELIDGIVEDGLPEGAARKLKDTRRKYRNFKTIEPLLEKGEINPTQLINRVAASPYIKASRSSLGEDDLVDLARIGKQLLPKKGGSDTFDKGLFTLGGGNVAGGLAAGAGAATDLGLTIGALTANRGLQKGIFSNQKLIDKAIRAKSKSPLFIEPKTLGLLSGTTPNTIAQ